MPSPSTLKSKNMPMPSRQSTDDRRQPKPLSCTQSVHLSSLRFGTLPLVFIALILFVWYAFANWFPQPPPKPDSTWARIVEEGTFRIGIDPSFPPFESDDGKGNLFGLDIALANEMAQDWSRALTMTIRVEYVYTGYDGLYDALKAGQFDAIISALPYDARKTEDARFSTAYFDGGPLIVVRESDTTTQLYSDLMNKRIGVELGSSGDSFARRWQRRLKYDLHQYNTPIEALRALRLGAIDAAFVDYIAYTDFARVENGIKTIGSPLSNELYVIAVRQDSPTLLGRINATIDAMKKDGRLEKLHQAWF